MKDLSSNTNSATNSTDNGDTIEVTSTPIDLTEQNLSAHAKEECTLDRKNGVNRDTIDSKDSLVSRIYRFLDHSVLELTIPISKTRLPACKLGWIARTIICATFAGES